MLAGLADILPATFLPEFSGYYVWRRSTTDNSPDRDAIIGRDLAVHQGTYAALKILWHEILLPLYL